MTWTNEAQKKVTEDYRSNYDEIFKKKPDQVVEQMKDEYFKKSDELNNQS